MATNFFLIAATSIFLCTRLSAAPAAEEPSVKTQKRSTEEFLKTLSPEGLKEFALMEERDRLAEKYRVRDRKNHVRQAPSDFKPEDARRKLKLTLIPERTMIRKGKRFSYQAEIQNVGRENVSFYEDGSFVLKGRLIGTRFKFLLIREDGEESELWNLNFGHSPPDSDDQFHPPAGWEKMSDQEKDEAIRLLNLEGQLVSEFAVDLKPGETIYTRDPRTGARFTELFVTHGRGPIKSSKRILPVLEQPGTYRIKLVYDDRPPAPPSETQIARDIKIFGSKDKALKDYQDTVDKSLGLIESNIVTFEITQ